MRKREEDPLIFQNTCCRVRDNLDEERIKIKIEDILNVPSKPFRPPAPTLASTRPSLSLTGLTCRNATDRTVLYLWHKVPRIVKDRLLSRVSARTVRFIHLDEAVRGSAL
jgi:hypothetical protein